MLVDRLKTGIEGKEITFDAAVEQHIVVVAVARMGREILHRPDDGEWVLVWY